MMRLMSIMVWVVFFFQGLYSTITLSLKINRVCNIIHGKSEDLEIDYSETALELVYMDATNGWRITNLV